MSKKVSNPLPPHIRKKPPAPPRPPPMRTFKQGFFGFKETTESIRATQMWWAYIKLYGKK